MKNPKNGEELNVELRPPKDESKDLASFVEWFSDNRVMQYLSMSHPVTESSERTWFQDQATVKDSCIWFVSVNGVLSGSIGLHRIDLQNRRAELGISLGNKAVWGKGVATAIEIAVADYAFQNFAGEGLHKLYARAYGGNKGSIKALTEKVGFRTIGVRKKELWKQGRWHDEWNGELLAEDWAKMRVERIKKAGILELNLYPGCE